MARKPATPSPAAAAPADPKPSETPPSNSRGGKKRDAKPVPPPAPETPPQKKGGQKTGPRKPTGARAHKALAPGARRRLAPRPGKPNRPTIYTPELGVAICALIREGKWLDDVTDDESMPCEGILYQWLDDVDEFSVAYTRARNRYFDKIAREIMVLADTPVQHTDSLVRETKIGDGKTIITKEIRKSDSERHRQLQIDTRKWLLARWDPKRYGDFKAGRWKDDAAPGGAAGAVDEGDESGELKITIVGGLPRERGRGQLPAPAEAAKDET